MDLVQISVAQNLRGALVTICEDEGFTQNQSALAMSTLALALAHFSEEGVRMFPEVLATSSIEGLARAIQCQDRLTLGTALTAEEATSKLLKHAAPLCRDGWIAYLQVETSVEYGVIRRSSSPLALPISVSFRDCNIPAMLFYQDVSGSVRVVGAKKSLVDINLQSLRVVANDAHIVDRLGFAITKDMQESIRDIAACYMTGVLSRSLRVGHGALVAVVRADTEGLPQELFAVDNVVILPPSQCLDFRHMIAAYKETPSVEVAETLAGGASLFAGMLMSDGITVITSSGRVIAYRAFLSSTYPNATGGARKRAYMTLASKVGDVILAAFMRSQDGHMEFADSGKGCQ